MTSRQKLEMPTKVDYWEGALYSGGRHGHVVVSVYAMVGLPRHNLISPTVAACLNSS
jgi:hypothetical protein